MFGCCFYVAATKISVRDVLPETGVEKHWLLRDQTDLGPQPSDIQLTNVHAVERNRAAVDVIEAKQQRNRRALATT